MLETICEIMEDAYKRNWITARDGNASVRWHDRDHFWVTPSGVRKQTLQPDQFKKIKINRTIPSGWGTADYAYDWEEMEYTDISKNLKPSGELPLHFGLQKEIGNSEVRVVIHVHPTYTVAAMRKGIPLNLLVQEFPELGRYTRVAPMVPVVPPISQDLANMTLIALDINKEGILQYDIAGIDRHGVVAIDTSPWRAYEHIERLEHICKIVLMSGV